GFGRRPGSASIPARSRRLRWRRPLSAGVVRWPSTACCCWGRGEWPTGVWEPSGPKRTAPRSVRIGPRGGGRGRGRVTGDGRLPGELARVDVVIAATSAPQPILDDATLAAAVESRAGRPLVVLDLAVPRNVDPRARDIAGLRLFDLDDLRLEYCPAVSGIAP